MRTFVLLALVLMALVTLTLSVSAQNGTNEPPTAVIDSYYVTPAGKGDHVFFSGHGEDEDGEVVAYQWRSNVTGVISRNASFNLTNLTAGPNAIYFSVVDDNGTWSSEDVQLITVPDRSRPDDEDDDRETAVPQASVALTVSIIVVIVIITIWINIKRPSE
jgi:hypothetical protein